MYERFFNINGWLLDLSSEYAKFKSSIPSSLNMPYQIFNEVDRTVRNITVSKSFSGNQFDHEYEFLGSRREYDINDSDETLNINDFSFRQSFFIGSKY